MEYNNKQLQRSSSLLYYSISFVLCLFLIALSDKFMSDLGSWKEQPELRQFKNKKFVDSTNAAISVLSDTIVRKSSKKSGIQNTIATAQKNYKNAQKSFDNWLVARKTLGSPKEDQEVLERAKELDKAYQVEEEWRKELSNVEMEVAALIADRAKLEAKIAKENRRAHTQLKQAIRQHDLHIFLVRLLFILPILLLGIFFLIKYRNHKYWPLFWGFALFSFYSFFLGLVPYLPDYGGYVRYTVGIVLSIVLGGYAINSINAFIQRKKQELTLASTERAKKVATATAEKALDNHMCPSCGKDFLMKQNPKLVANPKQAKGFFTNFCRFCGLELFKNCQQCSSRNFAHLPFCYNCGTSMKEAVVE